MYDFTEPDPKFGDRGYVVRYNDATKGYVLNEETRNERVFVWRQDPFYLFNGFSMSETLKEKISDTEKIYVLSAEEDEMFRFDTESLDGALVVEPTDDAFNNYKPQETQYVLKFDNAEATFDLPDDIEWL